MEKNYIRGFAKERKFDNGWSIIALTLNLKQLNKLPVDNYWGVKIDVCQRREVDTYWNTHYVVENTYKKQDNDAKQEAKEIKETEWDLPF